MIALWLRGFWLTLGLILAMPAFAETAPIDSAPVEAGIWNRFHASDDIAGNGEVELSFRIDALFQLSALLGEPVINCAAKWSAEGGRITRDFGGGRQSVDLADDQLRALSLYDLHLEMWVHVGDAPFGQAIIAFFCDAGIPGHGDDERFNVAGSPSWDRFICVGSIHTTTFSANGLVCDRPGLRWATSEEAKVYLKNLLAKTSDLSSAHLGLQSTAIGTAAVLREITRLRFGERIFDNYRAEAFAYIESMKEAKPGDHDEIKAMLEREWAAAADPDTRMVKVSEAVASFRDGSILGWVDDPAKQQAYARHFGRIGAPFLAVEEQLLAGIYAQVATAEADVATDRATFDAYRAELTARAQKSPGVEDRITAYQRDGRYGFRFGDDGEILTEAIYKWAGHSSEGLLPVCLSPHADEREDVFSSDCGYFDTKMRQVIGPHADWESVRGFNSGYAIVRTSESYLPYILINRSGQTVAGPYRGISTNLGRVFVVEEEHERYALHRLRDDSRDEILVKSVHLIKYFPANQEWRACHRDVSSSRDWTVVVKFFDAEGNFREETELQMPDNRMPGICFPPD